MRGLALLRAPVSAPKVTDIGPHCDRESEVDGLARSERERRRRRRTTATRIVYAPQAVADDAHYARRRSWSVAPVRVRALFYAGTRLDLGSLASLPRCVARATIACGMTPPRPCSRTPTRNSARSTNEACARISDVCTASYFYLVRRPVDLLVDLPRRTRPISARRRIPVNGGNVAFREPVPDHLNAGVWRLIAATLALLRLLVVQVVTVPTRAAEHRLFEPQHPRRPPLQVCLL